MKLLNTGVNITMANLHAHNSKRIAFIGEPLGELTFEHPGQTSLKVGGDVFNAAVYAKQVNSTIDAEIWAGIGRDNYSELFSEECLRYGVSTSQLVAQENRNIGLYTITTDKVGERHFNYWRSDSACRHYFNSDLLAQLKKQASSLDGIYLSGISLAIMTPETRTELFALLVNLKSLKIYFDDNYRPALWADNESCLSAYKQMIALADICFLSFHDQLKLFNLSKEDWFAWLQKHCSGIAVARNGALPLHVITPNTCQEVLVEKAVQVDTTAAGDSFSGAFIAEYLKSNSVKHALTKAKSVSAFVISKPGAINELPMSKLDNEARQKVHTQTVKAVTATLMTYESLIEELKHVKVVPVVALHSTQEALQVAAALIASNLNMIEITFRTPQAGQCIKAIKEAYPNMLIGAGTVLNTAQLSSAIENGADFIVSPSLNEETVHECQRRKIPIVPGVCTPQQIEQGITLKLPLLKFFPASAFGGVTFLAAMSSIYPVQFMPTGGISATTWQEYIALPNVLACGGSWVASSSAIKEENWGEISSQASAITQV